MALICMKIKLHAELILILSRFETEAQEKPEMAYCHADTKSRRCGFKWPWLLRQWNYTVLFLLPLKPFVLFLFVDRLPRVQVLKV